MNHLNSRLDFEQFDISGPINSCESSGASDCSDWADTGIADGGGCTVDKMAVTGINPILLWVLFDYLIRICR